MDALEVFLQPAPPEDRSAIEAESCMRAAEKLRAMGYEDAAQEKEIQAFLWLEGLNSP